MNQTGSQKPLVSDVTMLRRYVFLRYTLIKFAIHRSFFQNALVEYIGVYTDTNNFFFEFVRIDIGSFANPCESIKIDLFMFLLFSI